MICVYRKKRKGSTVIEGQDLNVRSVAINAGSRESLLAIRISFDFFTIHANER